MVESLGIRKNIRHQKSEYEIQLAENFKASFEKISKYKFDVKYVGEEEYFGFMISGNGRYLLDDCTVTHNTCTSIAVAENLKSDKNILVLLPASIRSNYIKALIDECGDKNYKTNKNKLYNKYHFVSYNASNTIDNHHYVILPFFPILRLYHQ